MISDTSDDRSVAAVRAEAAVWLARLRGPQRNAEVEQGFRRWLDASPAHGHAFELVNEVWEKSALLRRRPIERATSWERAGIRVRFAHAMIAMAAVAVLAVGGTVLYSRAAGVATAVGEQRVLNLEDGTRVMLNTNTRLAVHYDKDRRGIELKNGEARFEVAKRPDWPFIVTAGNRQIRALGTSFLVRCEQQQLIVTLVEGAVTVASLAYPGNGPTTEKAQILAPGQRLTLTAGEQPKLDRPTLSQVTAWERGYVSLDNTLLTEAVTEMNRYSTLRLTIERPETGQLRVSGLFRAGESVNFARAVARTYELQIIDKPGQIILAGVAAGRPPQSP